MYYGVNTRRSTETIVCTGLLNWCLTDPQFRELVEGSRGGALMAQPTMFHRLPFQLILELCACTRAD